MSKKYVDIIPSKSDAHRALICAALAEEPCLVEIGETSVDIEATKTCLDALTGSEHEVDLYCKESGSTLRFLIPVVGALGKKGIFHPEGRLAMRPLSPLKEELEAHGMTIVNSLDEFGETLNSNPTITVEGKLNSGDFHLPGDVSSQFISGLLFALPIIHGDSRIIMSGELQSQGYVDMTMRAIDRFGIKIEIDEGANYIIPGDQKYISPGRYEVEGDWSNAAPWLVADLISNESIEVRGLSQESPQGDRKITDILRSIKENPGHIEIDASQTPDLVPVIALAATQFEGQVDIVNAGRLRIKESDRLNTVAENLSILGANIVEEPEGLRIQGPTPLKGGQVDSYNDHRIAMMCAIASTVAEGKVVLKDSQAVNKSYPTFYKVLEDLGLNNNLELK